jgi:hypothetical protein
MENIKELVKDVANKNQVIETFAAKVIEVNKESKSPHNTEDAYTVNIMRADGAIIKNVRLKASIQDTVAGVVTIPKKDSWVLASVIDGVETRAYITQFSEVDRIMGRIQASNDPKLFFDYSADGQQLYIRYIKTESSGEKDETKITDVAKIEFDKDQNFSISYFDKQDKEPKKNINTAKIEFSKTQNFKISYFDDNEKTLAVTNFTPYTLATTFNTIKDGNVAVGSNFKLTNSSADLKFNNDTGKERNTISIKPYETIFSLKDDAGKTLLTASLNEDAAIVTVKESSATIDANEIKLATKDSSVKLNSSAIDFVTKGNVNITADGNVTISGSTVNIN